MGVLEEPWVTWEGSAAWALCRANVGSPVNAFELAHGLGLEVEAWCGSGAALDRQRRTIMVNPRARTVRRHGLIAHEVGHFVLGEDGYDSEPGARYMAGALMLPRREFDADLRRTAWSLSALRERHPFASAEMIARRIVQLRDGVATVIDNGRVTSRVPSPWLPAHTFGPLSQWEHELAESALAEDAEVRADELCYATPFVDGPWRRVIVVCDAEQLGRRLLGHLGPRAQLVAHPDTH